MTSKVLAEILTEHGSFERDGDRLTAPEDCSATMFVSLGQGSFVIERISEVDLGADVVISTTSKRERFAVAYEDVRVVRFGTRATGIRSPGY